MTLQYDHGDAPHRGRTFQIASGRRINAYHAGLRLAGIKPRTKLGALVLELVVQNAITTLQVVNTTAYVSALQQLQAPELTFPDPPPQGVKATADKLDEAYKEFKKNLFDLQKKTAVWSNNNPTNSQSSMLSIMVQVAGSINLDFLTYIPADLRKLKKISDPDYKKKLRDEVIDAIDTDSIEVGILKDKISDISSALGHAADALIKAASTGVLHELKQVYQAEINDLIGQINNLNNQVLEDQAKILVAQIVGELRVTKEADHRRA